MRGTHSGAFAVVKAGVNKFTAEKVAIKIVDKRRFALVQTSRPDALLAEARILQSCEHECVVKPRCLQPKAVCPHSPIPPNARYRNVIKFKGLFDSKRYLYIVLELYVLFPLHSLTAPPTLTSSPVSLCDCE